jgi:hypothetical protein
MLKKQLSGVDIMLRSLEKAAEDLEEFQAEARKVIEKQAFPLQVASATCHALRRISAATTETAATIEAAAREATQW